MEKEMVIGGIHTFLKSYADIKITVFSLCSFSAWDGTPDGEKADFFLLKEDMHSVKSKSTLKQKFLFKFLKIFFQLSEYKKR